MLAARSNTAVGQWGWGIAGLTLVAALLGLTARKDERPADAKPSTAAPAPGAEKSPRDFLRNYLRGIAKAPKPKPSPAETKPAETKTAEGTEEPKVELPNGAVARVLIASVPDPVDTPFAFRYDQMVESLIKAAAEAKYVVAGYWSPWELFRAGAGPAFEQHPGLLLFRQSEAPPPADLLAVFLVGETPNTLRAAALREALELADELRRHPKNTTQPLIAPFFSGNQGNLERALREWKAAPPWKFDIISGSATGLSVPEDEGLRPTTTLLPTELQINAAVQFLVDRRVIRDKDITERLPSDKLAFLVESSSGFGYSQIDAKGVKAERDKARILKYPMYISRLQSQYAQQRQERERMLGANVHARPAAKPPLRPNLDVAQGFDEAATPPLNDRAIEDLLAVIRRDGIEYVGIIATDPDDTIFLVERLRRSCPSAELFVPGMEMNFLLPENQYVMRGVVITSTYPLYPANQQWTRPDELRRQTFQSDFGQGCFNAAILHLAKLTDEPPGWAARHTAEYRPPVFTPSPGGTNHPPVWVMSVGENGLLVPHGFYDDFGKKCNEKKCGKFPPLADAGPAEAPPTVGKVRWPVRGPFRVITTLVLVVAGALVAWMLRRRVPWRAGGWRMNKEQQSASVFEQMILASALIVLALFGSILRALLESNIFEHDPLDRACLWAMSVVGSIEFAVAAALAVFWLFLRFCLGFVLGWRWAVRLAIHLLLLTTTFGFTYCLRDELPPNADAPHIVMYVERTTGVLTGHSVIPPVLLMALGFIAYGIYGLRRNYVGLNFRVGSPFDAAAGDPSTKLLLADINSRGKELGDMLTGLFDFSYYRPWTVGLILAPTLSVAALTWVKSRAIFEPESFSWVFRVGLASLSILVVLTIVRFAIGWLALRRVTRKLALVPMVGAYDRMARKVADHFAAHCVNRTPRTSDLLVPWHMLGQLAEEGAAPKEVKSAAQTRPAQKDFAADEPFPMNAVDSLNAVSHKLTKALAGQWSKSHVPDAFGAETPSDPKGWARLAEDFVAIQVIIFLSQFFIQLRYLAWSMVTVSLLLMLAATSYPFQPEQLLLYAMGVLLAVVCGALLWVIVDVNRDELCSRITRSTPNRLDLSWSFVLSTLQYIAPIVVVAVAQFSGRLRLLVVPLLEQLR